MEIGELRELTMKKYAYMCLDALAGARLPTVADAGEISPRSPAPKKSRASSKSRASTRGRIRAVDEEGGAKRSGSVLDLLANAAAQTG